MGHLLLYLLAESIKSSPNEPQGNRFFTNTFSIIIDGYQSEGCSRAVAQDCTNEHVKPCQRGVKKTGAKNGSSKYIKEGKRGGAGP